MSNFEGFSTDHVRYLHDEVDRILEDTIFSRSPIQSRLLDYLRRMAETGHYSPKQFEIAVDGLGKSEHYLEENDSYPRVQVSRLRASLAAYYARRQPHGEMCVYLRKGEYRLRLARREIAYPVTEEHHPAPEGDPSDTIPSPPPVRQQFVPSLASAEPAPRLTLARVATVAVVLAGLLGTYLWFQPGSEGRAPPSVALDLETADNVETEVGSPGLAKSVGRSAQLQLRYSFVSKAATGDNAANYRLDIDPGDSPTGLGADIGLSGENGSLVYNDRVAFEGDAEDFERRINSVMTFVFSPSGPLAEHEARAISGRARSAYECFLQVETRRGNSGPSGERSDRCLERFPESPFAAFWYARRAYRNYQAGIAMGKPVRMADPAWRDLMAALSIDSSNIFANFVAAKVASADGNCMRARYFVERAYDRGPSYAAQFAAAEAQAAGCLPGDDDAAERRRADLEAIIASSHRPDEMVQLNLILSALGIGDRELAENAAQLVTFSETPTQLERMSSILRSAILVPGYLPRNRKLVQRQLDMLVWSPLAREEAMETLEAGP